MTKLIWQKIRDVIGMAPIAFSPDNDTLIACGVDPDLRSFKFWDISETLNFSRFQFINTSPSFNSYFDGCIAISPDAQKFAIYTGFTIELWNLNNGQFLNHLFLAYDLDMPSLGISFVSDEKLIFWDNYFFHTWKFTPEWDRCIDYIEIARIPALCTILNCYHDHNKKLFLIMDSQLKIISLIENKDISRYYRYYNEIRSLEFQVVREIKIDNVTPTCLTINQTGSFLVVGYSDGIIRLYDAVTGELIRCFSKHSSSVKSVAISPDCRSIASAEESVDSETSIKVWNTVTGELNANLTNSVGAVTSLLFSPDSTKLAASSDSQVTLFALRNELPERTYSINDDHLANDEFF